MENLLIITNDFSTALPEWALVLIPTFIKGILVLAVTAGLTYILRNSSAALRYVLWTCGVVSLVMLPFLSALLPQIGLEVLPAQSEARKNLSTTLVAPSHVANSNQIADKIEGSQKNHQQAHSNGQGLVSPVKPVSPLEVVKPVAPVAPVKPLVSQLNGRSSFWGSLSLAEWSWKEYLLSFWLIGFLFCMGRLLVAHIGVWRIASQSRLVVEDDWQLLLENCSRVLGVDKKVRLRWNDKIEVPFNAGILKPTVFIPADASDWERSHRRTVMLHELAHVKRNDCLTHLITQLACAIHWINPLTWRASRELLIERERACDDLVIDSGTKPSEYAKTLLDTAREMRSSTWSTPATLAMARKSQLESRLLAILDPRRPLYKLNRASAVSAVSLMAIVVIPVAMAMPVAEKPVLDRNDIIEYVAEIAPASLANQYLQGLAPQDTIRINGRVIVPELFTDDLLEELEFSLYQAQKELERAKNLDLADFEYQFERAKELSNFEFDLEDHMSEEDLRVLALEAFEAAEEGLAEVDFSNLGDIEIEGLENGDLEAFIAKTVERATEGLEHVDLSGINLNGNVNLNGNNHNLGCCGSDSEFGSLAPGDSLTVEQIIRLKRYGVSGDFIREMKEVGFGSLSYEELIDLARYGVDGELVKAMRSAGFTNLDSDDVAEASRYGLDASDFRNYQNSGFSGWTLDELTKARRYGVDDDYLRALAAEGYTNLSADEVSKMARYGVDAESIGAMKKMGYNNVSADDLAKLSRYGVDAKYIQKIASMGYKGLSADELSSMSRYGVDLDLIRSMKDLGYSNLPVDDLTRMARYGVDGDDVREFAKYGLTDLSVDELVDLQKYGVDPEDIASFRNAGFTLSVKELVRASKYGLDADFIQEIADSGYKMEKFEDLISMSKYGVDSEFIAEMIDAGLKNPTAKQLIELRKKGVDADFIRSLKQ